MRRLLGTLALTFLLTLGLSACGPDDEGDGVATDPDASTSSTPSNNPSSTPSSSPSDPEVAGAPTVVELVSATAAGGRAPGELTPIPDEATLASYAAQFRGPSMAPDLESAYTEATDRAGDSGQVAMAIVSVGCDTPTGASIEEDPSTPTGYVVTPQKVTDPLPGCLAAVTTVAVVVLPPPGG